MKDHVLGDQGEFPHLPYIEDQCEKTQYQGQQQNCANIEHGAMPALRKQLVAPVDEGAGLIQQHFIYQHWNQQGHGYCREGAQYGDNIGGNQFFSVTEDHVYYFRPGIGV